ncbi:MAG TPA: hypothetical protein VIT83_03290, partial [Gammaproteobacteria bacterium]
DIEPLAPADVQAAGVGILDAEAQVVAILRALGAAESEEGVPALSMNGKAYIVVADDHLDVQEGVGATTDPAVWTRSSSNGLAALVPPFEVEGFDPNENGDHWDISERIGGVLALLANKAPAGAAPVFVNGGKIFAKDADGFVTVTGEETTAALTWGWLADGSVSPLVPAFTLRVAAATTGRAEILTEEQVAMVLDRLAEKQAGRVAFIASGKMFTRRDDGTLDSREHPAAEPVSWPLGHDVRPASQSLGVSACTDCHRRDAPFFFAPVTPHGPLVTQAASATPMHAFMDLDGPFQEMFGLSFQMRPLLKIVLLLMSGLMALVLLFLALKLIERAMKYAQEKRRV